MNKFKNNSRAYSEKSGKFEKLGIQEKSGNLETLGDSR
jgi:hypothetical protein